MIALVTGANKGIGFHIADHLLSKGFSVIVAARDESRGLEAVEKLKGSHDSSLVFFEQLDIADSGSIKSAASRVQQRHGGIDVLVNNAGMAFKGDAFDENVAATTFKTNYFGTVEATHAFLPLIKPGGRVINVSSTAGPLSSVKPNVQEQFKACTSEEDVHALANAFIAAVADGTYAAKGWPRSCYGTSKLCLSVWSSVAARKGTVAIFACCPGWCRTDMAGSRAPKSAEEGAETPVMLATAPLEELHSGWFYSELKGREWP